MTPKKDILLIITWRFPFCCMQTIFIYSFTTNFSSKSKLYTCKSISFSLMKVITREIKFVKIQ